jgi:hypothetical protein
MAARILERFGTPLRPGHGVEDTRSPDDRRTPVVA